MELRQVKYFLAVVETGTFTAASDRLGIVQSAVSQQIGRLERELGVALFDRSRRVPTLSAAGERFRSVAGQFVALEEQARAAAVGRTPRRVVRVGVPGGLDHPVGRLDGIETVHIHAAERQARVADGELDAAIVHGDETRSDLLGLPLPADRLVAVTAVLDVAPTSPITLEEFSTRPLVLYEGAFGTHLGMTVMRAARASGVEPNVVALPAQIGLFSAIRSRPGAWSVYYAAQAAMLDLDRLGIAVSEFAEDVSVPLNVVVLERNAGLGRRIVESLGG